MSYRSKFEKKFHEANKDLLYEVKQFKYVIEHTYTPDFYDQVHDIHYECKGVWKSSDRTKLLEVLRQNPNIRIVMIFQNPKLRLSKTSKTTYADWCNKHNIEWYLG